VKATQTANDISNSRNPVFFTIDEQDQASLSQTDEIDENNML
jgi:hypothetical protein